MWGDLPFDGRGGGAKTGPFRNFLLDEWGCAEEDSGQGYFGFGEEYTVKEVF
jgi:hypothetical protein